MKPKQILLLGAGVFLLGLLFWHTDSDYRETQNNSAKSLFGEISGEAIAGLELVQGDKKTSLVKRDGVWRVSDRSEFQAAPSKVRSALLKILDLNLSQRVSDGGDLDALGLSDKAVQEGKTKVSLLDSKGTAIGALYIGEERRSRKEGKSIGQLVRRDGQNEVWLAPEAIALSTAPEQWIDTELFSIPASRIWRITQRSLPKEETTFQLGSVGVGTDKKFQFTPAAELDDVQLSQVTGALEAAQLADVLPVGKAPGDLQFDMRAVYELENGLVYTLDTGKLGDKNYLKLSVRFAPDLAKEVSDAYAVVANKPAPTTEGQATPAPTPIPPKLELSSVEEAEKLQAGYKDWIFEVASYQADRLRQSREGLLKKR